MRPRSETVIVDLSADHRFDDAWYYGLPELTRHAIAANARISNPGCYATAMQLAIAPLTDQLAGPPQCFGVSGYSGAGTTPSDKNNPDKLRDNLMPYALVDHVHEREVSRQLGMPVEFMPHVAPHFRGITMTVNLWLQQADRSRDAIIALSRFLCRRGAGARRRRGALGQPHRRPASSSRSAASPWRRAASAWSSSPRSTTCSRAPRRRPCRISIGVRLRRVAIRHFARPIAALKTCAISRTTDVSPRQPVRLQVSTIGSGIASTASYADPGQISPYWKYGHDDLLWQKRTRTDAHHALPGRR